MPGDVMQEDLGIPFGGMHGKAYAIKPGSSTVRAPSRRLGVTGSVPVQIIVFTGHEPLVAKPCVGCSG